MTACPLTIHLLSLLLCHTPPHHLPSQQHPLPYQTAQPTPTLPAKTILSPQNLPHPSPLLPEDNNPSTSPHLASPSTPVAANQEATWPKKTNPSTTVDNGGPTPSPSPPPTKTAPT